MQRSLQIPLARKSVCHVGKAVSRMLADKTNVKNVQWVGLIHPRSKCSVLLVRQALQSIRRVVWSVWHVKPAASRQVEARQDVVFVSLGITRRLKVWQNVSNALKVGTQHFRELRTALPANQGRMKINKASRTALYVKLVGSTLAMIKKNALNVRLGKATPDLVLKSVTTVPLASFSVSLAHLCVKIALWERVEVWAPPSAVPASKGGSRT